MVVGVGVRGKSLRWFLPSSKLILYQSPRMQGPSDR